MQLTGTLNPFISSVHKFQLVVDAPPNSAAPYFIKPLATPFTVYLLVNKKYKLPDTRDLDGDNISF